MLFRSFHYLSPKEALPKGLIPPFGIKSFPETCATLLLSEAKRRRLKPLRALDLGCAVGRSSFELAKKSPEVVGIDFSEAFIRTARTLAKKGSLCFHMKTEGTRSQVTTAKAPQRIYRTRVSFRTGDALRLPDLGKFDLVLAANLVDRVKDPKKLLRKILPQLVHPGGLLLLTSPYTWTKEFTPRSRWLLDSFPTIRRLLAPHFHLVRRQDLPFLLREHCRKFQLTFADATLWLRRPTSSSS